MKIDSSTTMEQAKNYLERFRQAVTVQQQRAVAEEYRTFYVALPASDQVQADKVMQVLWLEIDDEVAELERLTQQAQRQLKSGIVFPVDR